MFAKHLARALLSAAMCGMCMGSSCWGTPSNTDTSSPGGSMVTAPSIEVTVDGTHVGPFAASSGAFASLTDALDQFGNVSSSMLQLSAAGGTDTCALTIQRFGADIGPFAAGAYTLAETTGDSTPDRTAELTGSITVTAGGLTLTCSSDDCAALFVIDAIDAAHLAGYLTATMQNPTDGSTSMVVATFYVPWQTYSP